MSDDTHGIEHDEQPALPEALESALDRARALAPAPPTFDAIVAATARSEVRRDPRLRWAAWLLRVGAGSLFAMALFLVVVNVFDVPTWLSALGFPRDHELPWAWRLHQEVAWLRHPLILAVGVPALCIPAVSLIYGARGATSGRFAGGVLARATAWSSLVVGVVIAAEFASTAYCLTGLALALSTGVALLVAGERGLDPTTAAGTPFQPIAFRGPLIVALVMAWADALTLLFSGVMQLRRLFGAFAQYAATGEVSGGWYFGFVTLACGLVMTVAVFGLFRLKVWALLLNIVANVAIAYMALNGTLGLPTTVAALLSTTACIQLLLPVPVLAAALGDRHAGRSWLHLRGQLAAYVLVVFLMLAALYAAVAPHGHYRRGWLEAGGVETSVRRDPGPVQVTPSDTHAPVVPRDATGRRLQPAFQSGRLTSPANATAKFFNGASYVRTTDFFARSMGTEPRWTLVIDIHDYTGGGVLRVGTSALAPVQIDDERLAGGARRFVARMLPVDDPAREAAPVRGHVVIEYRRAGQDRVVRDALVVDDHGAWMEVCPLGTCGNDLDPDALAGNPDLLWTELTAH